VARVDQREVAGRGVTIICSSAAIGGLAVLRAELDLAGPSRAMPFPGDRTGHRYGASTSSVKGNAFNPDPRPSDLPTAVNRLLGGVDQVVDHLGERPAVALLEGRALALAVVGQDDDLVRVRQDVR